jgi:uncharacterized protein (DUF697 family)
VTEQTARANEIVNRYWKWSAAAGLIPVPLIDVAAVTGIQLKMISDLAGHYEVSFSRDRAKSIVGSLTAAVTPPLFAGTLFTLLGPAFKMMPGVGTVIGVVTMPLLNAASTLALGRVFVQHFESGGTLLDMDPDRLREHYRNELEQAERDGVTEAR